MTATDAALARDHSMIGISWTADLQSAAETMAQRDIGALGVYTRNGEELLGIVTERDVMRAVAEHRDPARTKVREVMSAPLLRTEGPISEAAARRMMREARVRHLVIRESGADRIVSLRDV